MCQACMEQILNRRQTLRRTGHPLSYLPPSAFLRIFAQTTRALNAKDKRDRVVILDSAEKTMKEPIPPWISAQNRRFFTEGNRVYQQNHELRHAPVWTPVSSWRLPWDLRLEQSL